MNHTNDQVRGRERRLIVIGVASLLILGAGLVFFSGGGTERDLADQSREWEQPVSTEEPTGGYVSDGQDKSKSDFVAKTPEQNAKEVADKLTSTPQGNATADRLGNKDDQLTKFQKANGISERIAEVAIKEWVTKHRGNFDWDLEEVKAICLRNKRDGIR